METHPNINIPRLSGVKRSAVLQTKEDVVRSAGGKSVWLRKRARNAMLWVAIGGLVFGWVFDPGWYTLVAICGWLAFIFSLNEPSEEDDVDASVYPDSNGKLGYSFLCTFDNWWTSQRGSRPFE